MIAYHYRLLKDIFHVACFAIIIPYYDTSILIDSDKLRREKKHLQQTVFHQNPCWLLV